LTWRSGRLRRTELQTLPVVLDAIEVARLLEAVPSLKSRAALTAAYAVAQLHLNG
jgi:hypothetical protein